LYPLLEGARGSEKPRKKLENPENFWENKKFLEIFWEKCEKSVGRK